jgi:prepilin-type N-terminal cleavage/methylation domain-containing protein
MRAHRGFTLIEVALVIVIVGVIAAMAVPRMRAARRNASVQSTAFELGLWLDGLKERAIREQQDVVAIVVDVPNNDALHCAKGADAYCGSTYLVRAPPGFALNGFDPERMNLSGATHVHDRQLPRGIRFHLRATARPSVRPYQGVAIFDALLTATCSTALGPRRCVGVRFAATGEVEPIWPTGAPGPQRPGLALAIGSELTRSTAGVLDTEARWHRGSDQKGIVITFPAGLVKTFGVAE